MASKALLQRGGGSAQDKLSGVAEHRVRTEHGSLDAVETSIKTSRGEAGEERPGVKTVKPMKACSLGQPPAEEGFYLSVSPSDNDPAPF